MAWRIGVFSTDGSQHIDNDPAVLGRKPRIKGTRLSVELIVGRLAECWTIAQLREAYPHIDELQVRACLAYAATSLGTGEVLGMPQSTA